MASTHAFALATSTCGNPHARTADVVGRSVVNRRFARGSPPVSRAGPDCNWVRFVKKRPSAAPGRTALKAPLATAPPPHARARLSFEPPPLFLLQLKLYTTSPHPRADAVFVYELEAGILGVPPNPATACTFHPPNCSDPKSCLASEMSVLHRTRPRAVLKRLGPLVHGLEIMALPCSQAGKAQPSASVLGDARHDPQAICLIGT